MRFGIVDPHTVKFLDYRMKVGLFKDFYWTFLEIFIVEDYYFETKNKNPYILDCGGNIGMATLYFKWIYPESTIDVFEMEPSNIDLLENNIKSNNLTDVNIIKKAVSNENGTMTLFGGRRAGTIFKTLINEQVKKDYTYAESKIIIDTVKLSEYITKPVDFLKIDIEGAESNVFVDLDSSGKMAQVEKITLEFHRFSSDENKLSTIVDVLEKYDFDAIFLSNFSSLEDVKRSYYNYMIRAGKRHW